jgi:hypothetical protein
MKSLPSRQPTCDLSPRPSGYPDKAPARFPWAIGHAMESWASVAFFLRAMASSAERSPRFVAANGNAMCHLPSAKAVFSGANEADPSAQRESAHYVSICTGCADNRF